MLLIFEWYSFIIIFIIYIHSTWQNIFCEQDWIKFFILYCSLKYFIHHYWYSLLLSYITFHSFFSFNNLNLALYVSYIILVHTCYLCIHFHFSIRSFWIIEENITYFTCNRWFINKQRSGRNCLSFIVFLA